MRDTSQRDQAKRTLLERYLQQGNIESLAVVLRRQDIGALGSRSPLVAIHPGGTNRPFFFLHGDFRDHPVWCMNVARDLSPEQPFYALEPAKLDGRIAPTLEEHAAAHLTAVRTVQPDGPYMLGGWCGGALLAFEMAQQLHAAGQAVDLLVLMEPPIIPADIKLVRHLLTRLGGLRRLGPDKQLDEFLRVLPTLNYVHQLERRARSYLRRAHRNRFVGLTRLGIMELRKKISSVVVPVRTSKMKGEREDVIGTRPRRDYLDIFTWMAAVYDIRPCPSRVTFFWSSEEFVAEPRATRAWWRVAESPEVHVIAGTLSTCRTEHVHELSAHLRACLQYAQAAVPTS